MELLPLRPLADDDHPGRPMLSAYLLAEAQLQSVLAAQRRLMFELEESGDAALILCEHAPALSIGRSGSRAHILPDDVDLRAEGLTPQWLPRGGGCWLHTPGQLAGYLVGDVNVLGGSAERFLSHLEGALVRVLADFDVPAHADRARAGLFVGGKRVAALGIAVLRNMVHYGFLINVGPYLRVFDQLDEPGPQGYDTLRQTSMESLRVRPVPPARLRARLVQEMRDTYRLRPGPVFTESSGFQPLPEIGHRHVSR